MTLPTPPSGATTPLRLLSANLQAGATTRRYSDYVTQSWAHALPIGKRRTLDSLADQVRGADIAGVQESDSGSLRSGFDHQTWRLAQGAGLDHWHHQDNRRMGPLACSGNGLMSRYQAREVERLTLPGRVPGRGALLARFGLEDTDETFLVGVVHLSLGAAARAVQLAFLAERMANEPYAVLMGDFNCTIDANEMRGLWRHTRLEAAEAPASFPSWKPQRAIDHILATPALLGGPVEALARGASDHLMVARTIQLPSRLTD